MSNMNKIDEAIQSGLDHSLEELSRLCAQPSIAAQNKGMQECAQLVAEMLRARDFEVEILPSDVAVMMFELWSMNQILDLIIRASAAKTFSLMVSR